MSHPGTRLTVKKLHVIKITLVMAAVLFLCIPRSHAEKDPLVNTKKHFLWSVESGRNTIYLLGSMHILKRDSYPLPRVIEDIYGCCTQVVFETDMDGMNSPSSQNKILQLGMYPQGRRLSQSVSGQTFGMLKKRLNASGLPVEKFEQFRPWFVALSITAMEFQRLGFDPSLGVDSYFFNKATKDHKELLFLESNEFQIDLMAKLNGPRQELFLREILKELEIIETMSSDMVGAWKSGNVDRLQSILKISFEEYPEIYDRFFTRRNRKWVPRIERLMKQHNDVLIIVGAGHLVGKESVVDLLRKKGYNVRQR